MARFTGVVVCLGLAATGSLRAQAPAQAMASGSQSQLERVRAALDRYRDPVAAIHDGYFSTVACVEFPEAGRVGQMSYPAGGMGVHFLNVGLVGAPLDTLRPQVLIYEPYRDSLRLVAAEWFVPVQVTRTRPQIFGRDFDGPMEGHHPIMPPEFHHWDLHVWLWKPNPAGTFSPTNPAVVCPNRPYTFREAAPRMVEP